jgi:hypothetical protein
VSNLFGPDAASEIEPTEEELEAEEVLPAPEAPAPGQDPWWLVDPPRKKEKSQWIHEARSVSWFKKLSTCARQHAMRYRRKIRDPSGVDALVGNAVHGALEDAGRRRLQRNRQGALPATPSHAELLHLLEFQSEVRPDSGNGTEVLSRSREIIEGMTIPSFDGIVAVEELWKFWATPRLLLAGFADLVQARHRYRQDKYDEITITDYKTGMGQLPSREELSRDAQAGFYLIAYKRAFPWARVRFRILNVALNEEVWVDWSQQLEDLTLSFVRACHNLWSIQDETAVPGKHCDFCYYRHDCPAFERVLRDGQMKTYPGVEGMNLDQLLQAMYESKLIADVAETRRKDATKRIKELLPSNQKTYSNGFLKAYKRTRRLPYFRSPGRFLASLAQALKAKGFDQELEQLLDELGSIKAKNLNAFLGSLPESMRADIDPIVEQHKTLNSAPFWVEVKEEESLF